MIMKLFMKYMIKKCKQIYLNYSFPDLITKPNLARVRCLFPW